MVQSIILSMLYLVFILEFIIVKVEININNNFNFFVSHLQMLLFLIFLASFEEFQYLYCFYYYKE
jgi:hypothetical protein